MIKALIDMTVTEAASTALELIMYGDYKSRLGPQKYGSPFEGTFQDYVAEYFFYEESEAFDSQVGDYVPVRELNNFDTDKIWENLHSEGGEGTRDGWTAKVVTSFGGEGNGDQYWMVVSVSDGKTTRYFRKDGWYASYNGGYLDGETYEVKPAEKTIVVYE